MTKTIFFFEVWNLLEYRNLTIASEDLRFYKKKRFVITLWSDLYHGCVKYGLMMNGDYLNEFWLPEMMHLRGLHYCMTMLGHYDGGKLGEKISHIQVLVVF